MITYDIGSLCRNLKILCLIYVDFPHNISHIFRKLKVLYILNSEARICCDEIDLLICEFDGLKMVECPLIHEWQPPYNYDIIDLCGFAFDTNYDMWLAEQ